MSEYIVEVNENPTVTLDGWNVRCDDMFIQREEIVRCKDCKYMRHYHAEESKDRKDFYWCMLADWRKGVPLYRDSGFCAWGERRDDDPDHLRSRS